jgi:hypothetical protein
MDLQHAPPAPETEEFVTLIGADMDEIHAAFQSQGLAERHYFIVHRAGWHRFARHDSGAMFEGRPMIAATFRRHGPS